MSSFTRMRCEMKAFILAILLLQGARVIVKVLLLKIMGNVDVLDVLASASFIIYLLNY